jgi:hypothetical protein
MPEVGDARLDARKEERAAGARADRRSARVAWIPVVSAWLLHFTNGAAIGLAGTVPCGPRGGRGRRPSARDSYRLLAVAPDAAGNRSRLRRAPFGSSASGQLGKIGPELVARMCRARAARPRERHGHGAHQARQSRGRTGSHDLYATTRIGLASRSAARGCLGGGALGRGTLFDLLRRLPDCLCAADGRSGPALRPAPMMSSNRSVTAYSAAQRAYAVRVQGYV